MQNRFKSIGGRGFAKQIALPLIASQQTQKRVLLFSLHALGDHSESAGG